VRISLAGVVLGLAGIAIGITAVIALREASMSTHHPVAEGSQAVIELRASTKGGERGQTLDEMVEAVLLTCRLEVGNADLVKAVRGGDDDDDGSFVAVYEPGLDETNQRQLRGCLEDWTVDHLRIDVLSIVTR
jgi:hypothetical protein